MRRFPRRKFVRAIPPFSGATLLLGSFASPKSHGKNWDGSTDVQGAEGRRLFLWRPAPRNPVGGMQSDCGDHCGLSLLAKGAILSDGRTRNALCAFDYCELRTGAHDLFRRRLANALSVNELQVEVHCIHQHDAPLCDVNAEMLTDLVPSPPLVGDPGFIASASKRVASVGPSSEAP